MSDTDPAQLDYLLTLRDLERDGARTPLDIGPFAGLNLLMLLGSTARTDPNLPPASRDLVDLLTGRLATIGVHADLIGPDDSPESIAATATLMEHLRLREQNGERVTVEIGPFTAMIMIGMLQMVTRRPELTGPQRQLVRGLVNQLRPLFVGTPGEEIVNQGDHPEFDHPA